MNLAITCCSGSVKKNMNGGAGDPCHGEEVGLPLISTGWSYVVANDLTQYDT